MQVLLAMADELGKFVPYVGGPSYAHTLLVPLETLCCTEETVVREKAVESMALVGAELPKASCEEHFFPLVQVRARRGCNCWVAISSLPDSLPVDAVLHGVEGGEGEGS